MELNPQEKYSVEELEESKETVSPQIDFVLFLALFYKLIIKAKKVLSSVF